MSIPIHGVGPRWRQSFTLPLSRGQHLKSRSRLILCRYYHHDVRPIPLRLPSGHPSLLSLIRSSNNLCFSPFIHNSTARHRVSTRNGGNIYTDEELVTPFYMSTEKLPERRPIGFLRAQVANALKDDHEIQLSKNQRSPWHLWYTRGSDGEQLSVAFAPWVNAEGRRQRTLQMGRMIKEWRQKQLFVDILRGPFVTNSSRKIHDKPLLRLE
jgi:hypothetical protein